MPVTFENANASVCATNPNVLLAMKMKLALERNPRHVHKYVLAVGLVLTALCLPGCGGGNSSGSSPTGSTSPATTVTTINGPDGLTVLIPAAALPTGTTVVAAADSGSAPALPAGVNSAGNIYVLTPHGTTFASAVKVSIPFTPSLVPAGMTPQLYKAEPGGSFTPIASAVQGNFLVAQVTGFSFFVGGYQGTVRYSQLSRSCGRQALSGQIDCWGDLTGLTTDPALLGITNAPPTTVAAGRAFGTFSASGFPRIQATGNFLCGLSGIDLWCAGSGDHHGLAPHGGAASILGDGTTTTDAPNGVKVAAPAGIHFGTVTVGDGYACAIVAASGITVDGTVYCWGLNGNGNIGIGPAGADGGPISNNAVSVPTPVVSPYRYALVGASGMTTCAVRTTGEVDCWGDNSSGQDGQGGAYTGKPGHTNVPTQVPGVMASTAPGALAVGSVIGYTTICAITTAGGALCWGDNTYGQIGNGTQGQGNRSDPNQIAPPTPVSGGYAFKEIIQAGTGECGRVASGDTYCWGYGPRYSAPTSALVPQLIGPPRQFSRLSENSSCGIGLVDGKTYCWDASLNPAPLSNQ
jgi:hypothetical protein